PSPSHISSLSLHDALPISFFVAKDAGIYKKHGLDVDMVQLAGAVQTSALVAGEIDYLTGITSPLVAAARGLPFKGIMVTHEKTLDRKSTRLNSSHVSISYA